MPVLVRQEIVASVTEDPEGFEPPAEYHEPRAAYQGKTGDKSRNNRASNHDAARDTNTDIPASSGQRCVRSTQENKYASKVYHLEPIHT